MKCIICGEVFLNTRNLVHHLKKHNINEKEYYDKYLNNKHSNTCDICGKKHNRFINLEIGYNSACSKECGKKLNLLHRKLTLLKKYGVDNVSKLDEIKKIKSDKMLNKSILERKEIRNKTEKTNLIKYGYTNTFQLYTSKNINAFQLPEIKNKIKETNFKRYGVEYVSQNKEIREKIKDTNLKNYGCSCNLANEEQKELKKKTYFLHYGVDHYAKSKECKEKRKNKQLNEYKQYCIDCEIINLDEDIYSLKCKCLKCGREFNCQKQLFRHRFLKHQVQCIFCNPIQFNNFDSIEEKELTNYIKSIYDGKIIENDRVVLAGKELDIYLPDKNLAFEYDGLYWHNELYKDINYHLDKTKLCLSKNVQLIHIFENEWIYKKDIVKSRIASLLGLNKHIYARKTIYKIVSYDESKQFLNENHLQGNCISKYRYGLYYDNELVSLMTFGKSRFSDEFEMLRFCNKIGYNVIGGASKLFKHFLNDHKEIKEIISYADRRWSIGNLYDKLNFKFDKVSLPNYYYIFGNILKNRLEFQKHKLIKEGYSKDKTEHEIMLKREIYRIYDCGN